MSNHTDNEGKTRMAGSDKFKQKLSNAARNKQIREEIGNDPERLAKRISIVDRDKYDFDGYTDKQINMALQGEFGDEDYARLTGNLGGGSDSGSDGIGGDRPVTPPTIGTPGVDTPVIPPIIGDDPIIIGDDPFNVGQINATIGKRGNMTTSIGDGNTFGDGASIGNDNSDTRGSMMFGSSLSLPRRERAEEGAFAGLRFS